jgi:predicted small integral membrane protein
MMANLVAMIFVVLVMVLGIGACWVIAANGATSGTATDTFGNTPSADTVAQDAAASDLAVKSMPVLLIAFFIMVCVILVAAFVWLWKTGKTKASKY